jgi:hypothetical protein
MSAEASVPTSGVEAAAGRVGDDAVFDAVESVACGDYGAI